METVLALTAIGVVVFYAIKVMRDRTTVVVDDNSFYQNGVRVNFPTGEITIKKHTYPVSQITGIKSTFEGAGLQQQGIIKIEVNDFEKPIHKVLFTGPTSRKHAEEFSQRLSVALRKAGGPSFV